MPAKDLYHDTVKRALLADGWTITHDPFLLQVGKRDFYIDLGAEQLLAAEKASVKIAVEVKSFLSPSPMSDLEQAIGQFIVYNDVLVDQEIDRTLYLAVPDSLRDEIFDEPIGRLLLRNRRIRVILFDPNTEVITLWIPQQNTGT